MKAVPTVYTQLMYSVIVHYLPMSEYPGKRGIRFKETYGIDKARHTYKSVF